MYLHYCKNCKRIYILTGHHFICKICDNEIIELNYDYRKYQKLSKEEREELLEKCKNSESLSKLAKNYKHYKYSEWYTRIMSGAYLSESELKLREIMEKRERQKV